MQKTEIVIVRHGESLANLNRIMIGQTDIDLSERGREQARLTAEFLRGEHFDAIYSSDLVRAYNTAVPNAEIHNLPIIKDEGLRETYVGDWEYVTFDHLVENDVERYKMWREHFGTMVFPGGESTYGSGMRFYDTVLKIAKENLGRRILITSHAGVLRAFWGVISGFSAEDMGDAFKFATNASASYLYFDGERFVPERYSVNEHLESVGFVVPGGIPTKQ
jgi:broad specificity phosphatase PhoE